ncbi:MAG: hypothetical protein Ct9H300mP1_38660 [Planctomycetaceae bacterium]|nr:MAG: hypothetical protein Ct9H300mP1_38660 [Planctomycetaceae bacterium]
MTGDYRYGDRKIWDFDDGGPKKRRRRQGLQPRMVAQVQRETKERGPEAQLT